MGFYFLTSLLIIVFLYYKKTLNCRLFTIRFVDIGFLILIFIALMRFDVGWDYVNYYKYVDEEDTLVISRFEPLSQILFYIAIYFGSPHLVFLIYGIPTYLLIYSTIKKHSYSVGFSLLLYFCFFFLESLGFIRQALAVSICFWGIRYVFERRFIRYLVIVLLACLFHYSAVIALVIYPLYRDIKLVHLLWIIPCLFVIKTSLFSILSELELYTNYLEELDTMEGGALIRFFYIILFCSLLLLRSKKSDKQSRFFFFTIGLALTFPFLFGSHLGVRLSSYFFIYYILLIPKIILNVKLKYAYALMAFSFFMLTLYMTSKDPIKSQYIPYQFIFEVGDKPVFREAK